MSLVLWLGRCPLVNFAVWFLVSVIPANRCQHNVLHNTVNDRRLARRNVPTHVDYYILWLDCMHIKRFCPTLFVEHNREACCGGIAATVMVFDTRGGRTQPGMTFGGWSCRRRPTSRRSHYIVFGFSVGFCGGASRLIVHHSIYVCHGYRMDVVVFLRWPIRLREVVGIWMWSLLVRWFCVDLAVAVMYGNVMVECGICFMRFYADNRKWLTYLVIGFRFRIRSIDQMLWFFMGMWNFLRALLWLICISMMIFKSGQK